MTIVLILLLLVLLVATAIALGKTITLLIEAVRERDEVEAEARCLQADLNSVNAALCAADERAAAAEAELELSRRTTVALMERLEAGRWVS